MTAWSITIAYLIIGILFSIAVLIIFPPHGDFRPSWRLAGLAIIVYILLWPALFFMGCLYGIVRATEVYLRFRAARSRHRAKTKRQQTLTDGSRSRVAYRSAYKD